VQLLPLAKGEQVQAMLAIQNPKEDYLLVLATRLGDPATLAVPKLILREAPSFPEIAEIYKSEVLAQALPVFENLIAKGIAEGYLRPVDPELTIRSIMGPVLAHILLGEVFGLAPRGGPSMDRLVENHLIILFDGLGAPQNPGAEQGARP